MSAVDNMHSYAQIARAYADNTERLATAFDSLCEPNRHLEAGCRHAVPPAGRSSISTANTTLKR